MNTWRRGSACYQHAGRAATGKLSNQTAADVVPLLSVCWHCKLILPARHQRVTRLYQVAERLSTLCVKVCIYAT